MSHLTKLRIGLRFVFAVSVCAAQTPPASRRLQALAAFVGTCDHKTAIEWVRETFSTDQFDAVEQEGIAARLCALGKQTGRVKIDRIETRDAHTAEGFFQGETVRFMAIVRVESNPPHRIVAWGVRPAEPPIPRNMLKIDPQASEKTRVDALRQAAETLGNEGKFSGAVLVARGDTVLYRSAFGLSNVERHEPNTVNTKFHLGSMPKMFTAVAAAQLVARGKMSLDKPIATWLPDYPDQEAARRITLHHLLTHTSGLGDYFGPLFDRKKGTIHKLEDYYEFFAGNPLRFEPGKSWAYSNAGFLLVGILIERASGMSYYDYLERHVFAPLEMKNTGNDTLGERVPMLATGYTRHGTDDVLELRPPTKENFESLPPRGGPAGGGYSTLGDLHRFALGLLRHRLLDSSFTELVTRGKVDVPGRGERYAYGFQQLTMQGKRVIGHGGGAEGMNGMLLIEPKEGYIVVVLSNWDPPVAEMFAQRAMEALVAE
jgi:D-alanyl-D-alanine carboxypeptidase